MRRFMNEIEKLEQLKRIEMKETTIEKWFKYPKLIEFILEKHDTEINRAIIAEKFKREFNQ